MSYKVFNQASYETKDNTKINYSTPRTHKDGFKVSYVSYLEDGDKLKIGFETEPFTLSHGIQKTQNGIHFIDLKFDDTNNLAFHEFVGEMDELGIGKTWENSKKWFGDQMDQELVDNFYRFPLRTNGRGVEPYMRIKLDGENLLVTNQYGKELELGVLSSGSKIKLKVRYEGLAFFKQLFAPIYKVYEIKFYQERKKEKTYAFYTDDNSMPDLIGDGFETELEDGEVFYRGVKVLEQKETTHTNTVSPQEQQEAKELTNLESKKEETQEVKLEEERYKEEKREGEQCEGGEEEQHEEGQHEEGQHEELNHEVEREELVESVDGRDEVEEEREDVGQILSKNITKKLGNLNLADSEATETLEFNGMETVEELEEKTRKVYDYLSRLKTERSNNSTGEVKKHRIVIKNTGNANALI